MTIRFSARVPVQIAPLTHYYQFVNARQAEQKMAREDGVQVDGNQTLTLYGHSYGPYPWMSYWTRDGVRKGGLLVNSNTLYTGADLDQLLATTEP